ncbi:hypothetical protein A2U01_0101021, partial [Trifolium medium]|nr:hypothetical protein [Trifolium medium]
APRRECWRVAPLMLRGLEFLLSSARRAGEDGASRLSVRNAVAGRFGQWRVAHIHMARRAPS